MKNDLISLITNKQAHIGVIGLGYVGLPLLVEFTSRGFHGTGFEVDEAKAQQSAPVIVSTPASAHAISSQPGEPTSRDDSAEVMKIPDPIIEPTTIIVASSRLSPRTSFGADSLAIRSDV